VTRARQGGILLLPVALTLALLGTLAYALTSEGSMSAADIDAKYEIEAARYLATGAVNLARWQNERISCNSAQKFTSLKLGNGTITADEVSLEGKSTLNISVTAKVGSTARSIVDAKSTRYDRSKADSTDLIIPSGGNDSSIKRNAGSLATDQYLQTTEGSSHAVLKFDMPPEPKELKDGLVVSARLTLTHASSNTQAPRSLGVHRVTSNWGPGATWSSPWNTEGGDYLATPLWTVPIDGNSNANVDYTWRIDALVQGWLDGTIPKRGLLLKPIGPLDAKFYSLDAPNAVAVKPRLVVRFYPRC